MDGNPIISALEAELQSLETRADFVKKSIFEFKKMYGISLNSTGESEIALEDYATWKSLKTYKEKFAFILKREGRFLNIKEIVEIARGYDDSTSVEELKNGLSSAKSNLISEGKITKYAVGNSNKNTFYGSKSWLNEQGEILPGHTYDESQVTIKTDVEI
jgi:hypothetical protein